MVMDDRLREMVEDGATVREIASAFGIDRSTVRRRLRRYGLQTERMARLEATAAALAEGRESLMLRCARHGLTEFGLRENRAGFRCLRCRSLDVSNARRRRKELLVREAGGRCQGCGYDAFIGALQFHHRDPARKAFAISGGGIPRALDRARREAGKCVLLCANCHAEVEAGVRVLSEPIAPP
jgi:transposase-like protein